MHQLEMSSAARGRSRQVERPPVEGRPAFSALRSPIVGPGAWRIAPAGLRVLDNVEGMVRVARSQPSPAGRIDDDRITVRHPVRYCCAAARNIGNSRTECSEIRRHARYSLVSQDARSAARYCGRNRSPIMERSAALSISPRRPVSRERHPRSAAFSRQLARAGSRCPALVALLEGGMASSPASSPVRTSAQTRMPGRAIAIRRVSPSSPCRPSPAQTRPPWSAR